MENYTSKIVAQMKDDLLRRVDEWIGFDIPDEGDDDYERWQAKLSAIEEIENIYDVIAYLEDEGGDVDDFFVCGEYNVISAGLDPEDVTPATARGLGEPVADRTMPEGLNMQVFSFDGMHFVICGSDIKAFANKLDALGAAGISTPSPNAGHEDSI